MSAERWMAVDEYIDDLFVPPDPALEAVLRTRSRPALHPGVSQPAGACSPSWRSGSRPGRSLRFSTSVHPAQSGWRARWRPAAS